MATRWLRPSAGLYYGPKRGGAKRREGESESKEEAKRQNGCPPYYHTRHTPRQHASQRSTSTFASQPSRSGLLECRRRWNPLPPPGEPFWWLPVSRCLGADSAEASWVPPACSHLVRACFSCASGLLPFLFLSRRIVSHLASLAYSLRIASVFAATIIDSFGSAALPIRNCEATWQFQWASPHKMAGHGEGRTQCIFAATHPRINV